MLDTTLRGIFADGYTATDVRAISDDFRSASGGRYRLTSRWDYFDEVTGQPAGDSTLLFYDNEGRAYEASGALLEWLLGDTDTQPGTVAEWIGDRYEITASDVIGGMAIPAKSSVWVAVAATPESDQVLTTSVHRTRADAFAALRAIATEQYARSGLPGVLGGEHLTDEALTAPLDRAVGLGLIDHYAVTEHTV